jgi:hypothetical protein
MMAAGQYDEISNSGAPDTNDSMGDARSDWLLSVMGCGLIFVLHASFLIADLLGLGYHPVDTRLRAAIVLMIGGIVVLLLVRRDAASRWLCAGAFALAVLPFFVTFWISESSHALEGRLGHPWEPFLGAKVLSFVIAGVCPVRPRWLGAALLALAGIHQVAFWLVLDLGSPSANVSVNEPATAVIAAVVAWALLGFRLNHNRHERELFAARSEASILRTTNEAFLAVQDMANTPLQNLELAISLMEQDRPQDPVVQKARRSLDRLRLLGQRLPVTRVTSASVDARSLERVRNSRAT